MEKDLESSLTDIGWLSSKLHPTLPEDIKTPSFPLTPLKPQNYQNSPNNAETIYIESNPYDEITAQNDVTSSTPLEKPGHSYASLIAMAIRSSPAFKMTLSDIYHWISEAYPFYKQAGPGWKNSIRHNLSLNKCFVKLERTKAETGKGSYWTISQDHQEEPGAFRIKQRFKTTPYYTTQTSDPINSTSFKGQDSFLNINLTAPNTAPPLDPICTQSNMYDISSTSEYKKKLTNQIQCFSLAEENCGSTNQTMDDIPLVESKLKIIDDILLASAKSRSANQGFNNFLLAGCKHRPANQMDAELPAVNCDFKYDSQVTCDPCFGNMGCEDAFIDSAIELDSSFDQLLNLGFDDLDPLLTTKYRNIDWMKESFRSVVGTKLENISLSQFPLLAESFKNAENLNSFLNGSDCIDFPASFNELFKKKQTERKDTLPLNIQTDNDDATTILRYTNQLDKYNYKNSNIDESEDEFDWERIL